MTQFDQMERTPYQRSKRSDKKLKAQCQIKTKHAKSIRYNSHNKQLYIHHRLFKRVHLDPPSYHFLASPPPRSVETIKPDRYERNDPNKTKPVAPAVHPSNQFREYTIHENNIPNEPAFDDAMIAFLLDMQNRDLYDKIDFVSFQYFFSSFVLVRQMIMKCYYDLTNVYNVKLLTEMFSTTFKQSMSTIHI